MREAKNIVRVEGILSEIDLGYHEWTDRTTNKRREGIRGLIKVRVEQKMSGEDTTLEVPIHFFAPRFTNSGGENPSFTSIDRVMKTFKSIAAVGEEEADRVRVTGARIQMNEYYGADGNLVSFPRINGAFVNKVVNNEFDQGAVFEIEFVLGKIEPETDREGVETGRHKVTGVVPLWRGVDVVPFYSDNPKVTSTMTNYWREGTTVRAVGKLNFTSKTYTEEKEIDFGEPMTIQRTSFVSELIITGGARDPLPDERAYQTEEIQQALAERKAKLEAQKERDMSKTRGKDLAPSPISEGNAKTAENDLGF